MIIYKSDKQIEVMREGGKILSDVLWEVCSAAKAGISEIELDALAEKLILHHGAEPSFKRVPGYNHTICVSTNDVVVHGIPSDYILKNGDIIGIDCGVYFKGLNTDMSETIAIGKVD